MKKSLFFILIFVTFIFANLVCPQKNASAQSEYARILNENTMFYSNPDCTVKRFILPYGYFVRILQIGVDSTRVCYMDGRDGLPERVGYIKTSDLYFFDGDVVDPYPQVNITIISDEVLFSDTDMQYPKTVLSAGQSAYLYGELQIFGENFCYVYSGGFIGYVRKSAFANFSFPAHPTPIITQQPSSDLESVIPPAEMSDVDAVRLDETLKIAIIVAVCIICISIVYLIFRPKNQPLKPISAWDEDEYF